jgi:hypothetical protein
MCDADLIESKGQNTVTGQPEENYVTKGGLWPAPRTGVLQNEFVACFLDGEVLMPDPDL